MVPLAPCIRVGSPVTVPVTPGPEVLPMTVSSGASVLYVAREEGRTCNVLYAATA